MRDVYRFGHDTPQPAAPKQPSPYQAAIYEWIEHGTGSAVVAAVAGSGKTTTLVHAAALARGRRIFVAFNRSIVEELSRRLPADVTVSTLHSAGYRAIRQANPRTRYKVDQYKYRDIIDDVTADRFGPVRPSDDDDVKEERRDLCRALSELADKARLNLTDPADADAVWSLAAHHSIAATPAAVETLPAVIRAGNRAADRGIVDFTDMVYLPAAYSLPMDVYDWVFCDEAQDLNRAQLALIIAMMAPGARAVAVGDVYQAIYGFAGADSESMARTIAALDAVQLPLHVCYRCPRTHLDLARAIVPHVEARPDAPDGEVLAIDEEQLPAAVGNGDLVLCRMTAPLISQCIRMIAARIPARVRGRDVAKQLTGIVRDMHKRTPLAAGEPFPMALSAALDSYRERERAKAARRRDAESAMQAAEDRIAGIVAVSDGYACQSADALCEAITSLFSDDAASVWLSTVHRAKGLEARRVFLLRPDKMPLAWPGQQPWEQEQERNILYVALTRATETLTYVLHDSPAQPDADALKA